MASIISITRFLNKELNIKKISDVSKNGLQVKPSKDIKKIAFAVDACMETFKKAKKEKCDLIIVHHGLFWKKDKRSKDVLDKRVKFLKKNKISLYASHLPLDLNNKHGNNSGLAKLLRLKNLKKFGKYHGINIGYSGKFEKAMTAGEIKRILDKELKTRCLIIPAGKKVRTIGIVSGWGASLITEAINKKLDCFLTGETDHTSYHYAKEANINIIFAGHYATETVGVKALMPVIEKKFGVKTVFIDSPTGL